jgi:hypothetical protein
MKLDQFITVLTSVALSILGWLIAYLTTIRRDRLSKKRDLRVQISARGVPAIRICREQVLPERGE